MEPFNHWRIDNEYSFLYTEHEQFAKFLALMYGNPTIYEKGNKEIGWQFKVKNSELLMLKAQLLGFYAKKKEEKVPVDLEPSPIYRSQSSQVSLSKEKTPPPTSGTVLEKWRARKKDLDASI